jgi:hypothetical protein
MENLIPIIIESFPFYYELKCIALIYLQWNQANMSVEIFNRYFRPIVNIVEPYIDKFLYDHRHDIQFLQRQAISAATHFATNPEVVETTSNLFSQDE